MKDGIIEVAAACVEVAVGDPKKNIDSIVDTVKCVADENIAILTFPHLCVTGATAGDLFFTEKLLSDAEYAVGEIAKRTADTNVLFFVGMPVKCCGKLYAASVAICKGEIVGAVPKSYYGLTPELDEKRYFSSDVPEISETELCSKRIPFGTKILFKLKNCPSAIVGCVLSDDLFAPVSPAAELCAAGATVIVNPSATAEIIGREEYRRLLVMVESGKQICACVLAEASPLESTTDFVMASHMIIAENGNLLGESKPFGELDVISAIVDTEHLLRDRRKLTDNFVLERYAETVEVDLETVETSLEGSVDSAPFISDDDETYEKILNLQAHGLAKRLCAAYAKEAVLGISGGLDSCLALLVAVRSMELLQRPMTDILAITMPCYGTTERTRGNAEILCDELGVSFRCVDIAAAVAQHFADIGHNIENHNVVFENAQARERTQIIMDIANADGGIVVGTGDLSELALGWATYNGDHMSNYGVNGNISKTLVRKLVDYEARCATADGKVKLAEVLFDILDTPVSPELLPPKEGEIAQKTEDIVGPYELHDFFLHRFVRYGETPEKILRTAVAAFDGIYTEDIIKGWLCVFLRRFITQQFKRSTLPDGVKVGSVGLSPRGDFRLPSDAAVWNFEL